MNAESVVVQESGKQASASPNAGSIDLLIQRVSIAMMASRQNIYAHGPVVVNCGVATPTIGVRNFATKDRAERVVMLSSRK